MKHAFFILVLMVTLTGCGTTRGLLNGAGTVFEGIANDFHGAGGWLGG